VRERRWTGEPETIEAGAMPPDDSVRPGEEELADQVAAEEELAAEAAEADTGSEPAEAGAEADAGGEPAEAQQDVAEPAEDAAPVESAEAAGEDADAESDDGKS
jgi:hypothetical protein